MLSPTAMLDFSTIPTASVRYFWWSLVVVHLLAWALFALAGCVLPHSWQAKSPPRPLWVGQRAGSNGRWARPRIVGRCA